MRRILLFASFPIMLAACTTREVPTPSLAPRAAEAIDPRIEPAAAPTPVQPVDAALAEKLAGLVAQAIDGNTAFEAAASRAENLVASAGAAQSESWIAAQEALSQAVAARGETARALGDVDAMAADSIAAKGTIGAADFAAIRAAADKIADIDHRQAARIGAMRTRLGS
jgi:hypothetical protein